MLQPIDECGGAAAGCGQGAGMEEGGEQEARQLAEELATLRDVHEGYHRYILGADMLAAEEQKLGLQLETNKVSTSASFRFL